MKRQLLTLLLLVSATIASAQKGKNQIVTLPIDSTNGLITYGGVIQVEGATQNDLYLRSREWFAKQFYSRRDVIQMDDKEAGKVIGMVHTSGKYRYLLDDVPYFLEYIVSLTSKDGRYRYEISSISIRTEIDAKTMEAYYRIYQKGRGEWYVRSKRIIPQVAEIFEGVVGQLKYAMRQSVPAMKPDSKDDF